MSGSGYAGRILKVNLTSRRTAEVDTAQYAKDFIGGRGIAARLYWDGVPPSCSPFDAENQLIFMTGPACDVPGFGSRFQVCGKSAISGTFSYCNLGGSWGAHLKRAGYDGALISGASETPVYLLIDNGKVEIRDASHLAGTPGFTCESMLKKELGEAVSVLTIGPAGENGVVFATLLAADNSCGTGGLAAVMGSKNLKAMAVRGEGKVGVADRDRLVRIRARLNEIRAGLPESMKTLGWLLPIEGLKPSICHACPTGCVRVSYRKEDGSERKFMCQAALFYQTRAERFYGGPTRAPLRATEVCDDYGLDTRATETMIMWLSRCHKSGLLSDEQTGIPLSKMGSTEFIESLVSRVARREGFGDLLAGGTSKAAEALGSEAQKHIKDYMTATGDNDIYGPRLYMTTGIFYAMEPRMPIHQLHEVSVPVMMWAANAMGMEDVFVTSPVLRAMAGRMMGSEEAMDFSTCAGKAVAAVRIQDREFAKESLILCDLTWPVFFDRGSGNSVGDPSIESQVYSAISGNETDEEGLYAVGERVFNLQRAILAREGHAGRAHDTIDEFNFTSPLKGDFGNPECIVPGAGGAPTSRKGAFLDRDEFEALKSEFYGLRGWDISTGLQSVQKLGDIGLSEMAVELERLGLAA